MNFYYDIVCCKEGTPFENEMVHLKGLENEMVHLKGLSLKQIN